jgi:Xaa-Pro aminopeptidase
VLFGARTALPHGTPTSRRLKRGDWILFDFGCTLGGLCSDMTRTFVMGPAAARQKEVYRTVQRAQAKARRGLWAGMGLAKVDGLARSLIEEAGYGSFFGHATGHGVGLRIHEAPRIGPRSRGKVPRGAVVTIEPGIYIPKFGGVRIEDTLYVGGEGPRLLTRFSRGLMEL